MPRLAFFDHNDRFGGPRSVSYENKFAIFVWAEIAQPLKRDHTVGFDPIVEGNQWEEENMKIASLIAALIVTAALTAVGQEGVVQDVKHGAKKAGETIKDGLETAGEKTKDAAKTVGKKTKETAETVATKTKETVNGTGEKAADTTRKTHHKSRKTTSKTKAQSTEEQTTDRESTTPAQSPAP